jgi:hypothetical protein
MSPLRVVRGFIFGAIGGFLGWVLVEFMPFGYPFQPARYEAPGTAVPLSSPEQQGLLGLALGLAIGGFLGISEGIAEGTNARFKRAFGVFLALGAAGGFMGLYFGQQLFGMLGGKVDVRQMTEGEFFPQLLIRSMAWMLIGLFLGTAMGAPNLSARRAWNGAVGGAIGGFLGGAVFQLMAFTQLFAGMQSRLVGFTILGAAIGFFINLVAEAMKRVWVKVLIGRNEGREYVLDTPLAYAGRDELADIPVFLDPAVPKRMASFRLSNGRYALYAETQALPMTVNGQPAAPGQVLRDGDAIQFGRVTLGFFEKATMSGMARPVDRVPLADHGIPSLVPGATPIPTGPNVCEFCGEQRDPATGGCSCTVPAGDPSYAPAGYDAGGYGPPGGYAPPGYDPQGYAQPGYADPGYAPAPPPYGAAPDPAYAATMMDPGNYAAPAGGPRLVVFEGPYAGNVFPLGAAELGIGRDPGQDIPLSADSAASRRHARLIGTYNGWVLRDEGSSNGTWVNGVRIQEQPLFPGDTVRIGATQFRFEA